MPTGLPFQSMPAALAGGIATAQTQITYIADGSHSLVGITSITTANGRITAKTAP